MEDIYNMQEGSCLRPVLGAKSHGTKSPLSREFVTPSLSSGTSKGVANATSPLLTDPAEVINNLLLLKRQRGSDTPVVCTGTSTADNRCRVGRARRAVEVENAFSLQRVRLDGRLASFQGRGHRL